MNEAKPPAGDSTPVRHLLRSHRLNPNDSAYLEHLRTSTRATLVNCLREGASQVVLLDAPTYRNFGDSLIWEGTRRYLAELGLSVAHTSDIRGFRDVDLRKAPREAPLLLHGGGNFGDLWPAHEQFRRHIAETYPDRRIILLPQSIHFRDRAEFAKSAAIYTRARSLTILLRDTASMRLAADHLADVHHEFCYDLAFGVRPPLMPSRRRKEPLVLARVDQEARPIDRGFANRQGSVDWNHSTLNQWVWDRAVWAKNYYRFAPHAIQRMVTPPGLPYDVLRRLNVVAATRQLASAPVLVTNRLHAHVLATLLGIPHVATDNSYGKVKGIFNDYSGRFSTAHWADSLTEAYEMALDLSVVTWIPPPVPHQGQPGRK